MPRCVRTVSLLSPAPRLPSLAAPAAALPRVSSLLPRIRWFFVRGGRRVRRPVPAPLAPGETTTAAAVEWCTANAPVACSGPPLLVPKRNHGIDPRRPTSWKVHSDKCHGNQQERGLSEGKQVVSPYPIEETLDYPRR